MPPTDPDLPRQSLDLAFRSLWKHRPASLAMLALGRTVRNVEPRSSAVIVAERAPDAVATVLTDDGPCTLHLEFETSVKPAELPCRMAHAGWALHGPQGRMPVRSVAVLLDPHPSLPQRYDMKHADHVIGTYCYSVLALSALPVDALLDAPVEQAGLLALVPLASGATHAHVTQAARRMRSLDTPDAPDLAVISLMLGARTFGYDDLVRIFREDFLMLGDGWAYIERKGFDKGRSAGLQEGLEQGIEKGIEQGLEKGLEQGRHQAARAALRTVCSARFGTRLDSLAAAVPDASLTDALAAVAAAADPDAAQSALERLRRA
jgi:predicted transposase YdaD